mmetsp:Transcript_158485/g.508418  ORF Transcript_158485/g.508418 Transcript_158485/m.508418 type:complete len:956 (-) Transcript_158485:61-2928(-)
MAVAPSMLDKVGQGFLDAASSLDADIDASSLVDRLSGDADPTSQKVKKALAELKELVRRAPWAVVATPGAVPAMLRVINKLAHRCGQDGEDDAEEPLQDALEALGQLLGDEPKAQPSRSLPSSPKKGAGRTGEDEAAARRGLEVAELAVRHTDNGKELLRILSARSVSSQFDVMVVLQRIYRKLPDPINKALLADPMALNRLMEILQNCQIDYVRNESLGLLLLLTASNKEIQQIVTMQGLADTVFALLAEEDLGTGGRVARDLLQCLTNLAGSATCQRCIRETGGLASLVQTTTAALLGKRLMPEEGEEDEEEDVDDDEFGRIQRLRVEVSQEARWACFLALTDVALAFAGATSSMSSPSGDGGAAGEVNREVVANRDALVRNGVLDLLRRLPDPRVDVEAKLRLVRILEALEPTPLAATRLEQVDRGSTVSLLSALASMVVSPAVPLPLKSALSRVLCRTISRHSPLQLSLLASLSPQIEPSEPGEEVPAMRQVVAILEKAASGRPEPQPLWFAFHLLLAMLFGNTSVQRALPSMRIAFHGGEEPAEFCLDLFLMAFSGCARRCLESSPDDEEPSGEFGSGVPDGPASPAAALVAALKLLAYWLASCPPALASFAGSPVMVPRTMDLILIGSRCGDFFRAHLEGLAALVMGLCIKADEGQGAVAGQQPFMALLAKKVGIEEFQRKGERLFRSEVMSRPPRNLANFRWYNSRFRSFLREQQQAIQRRMVQLYVSDGIGGGSALAEDVADQYKQLIRVQDAKFREVQNENEQLRSEVETFMSRSLQASSEALLEKMEALRMENEALHKEVAQLEEEGSDRIVRLERELRQSRSYICELEQQRQSMAVGYEQVERSSEALRRELEELRSGQKAADRSRAAGGSELVLALAAEDAQRRVEELERERADMLELMGCIIGACPEAKRFVASLEVTSAGAAWASGSDDVLQAASHPEVVP